MEQLRYGWPRSSFPKNLIRHALPRLVEAFESIRSSFFTAYERQVPSDLYPGIGAASFSQDVLSTQPNGLAVLRATDFGWSDPGEPGGVFSILERKGVQTDWGFNPGCGDRRVMVCKAADG